MPKSQYAHPFKILKNEQLTEHFFLLEGVSLWKPDLSFEPGQYLMTDAIILNEYLRRSYSPFLLPTSRIGLLIQRNPDGVFSSYMVSKKKDEVIRISGPTGKDKSIPFFAENVVVLAFDNGISFVKNLLSWKEIKIPVRIFWNAELIKSSEASELISNLFPEHDILFCGTFEKMTKSFLNSCGKNTVFYLSGNGQSISFFEQILRSLEISDDRIIKEIYFNHQVEPDYALLEEIKKLV